MSRSALHRLGFLRQVLAPEDMKILDVGANPINVPAYQLLIDRDMCHVWGFEPNPKAFADLEKAQNARATYFPVAIGPEGRGTFYAHEFAVLSSLFPIHKPSADFLGRERWYQKKVTPMEMDLVTLDSLDELPRVDLLKMDLQGGELAVMQGGRDRLSEAVAVIPEVRFHRMYEGEPLWAELDLELRAQGFKLHKFMTNKALPVKNSQWRRLERAAVGTQLLDGDAVYIRNLDEIDTISSHQLKQLALASAIVFDSFDVTLHCLDALVARGEIDAQVPKRFVDHLPPEVLNEKERGRKDA